MSVADPIAWVAMEDALAAWVRSATAIPGDRVRVQSTRGEGEARGPAPKAVISFLSVLKLQTQDRTKIPRVMQQRYTVVAGAGEVGVDFYPGFSGDPQRISIIAGAGDPPATSAAALLVELVANLPAGYSASADPMDPSSVLVDGTDAEPLFASAAAVASLLVVSTVIPRHVILLRSDHNIVWRVSFRSGAVSGSTTAANSLAQCDIMRESYLDPAMRKLGFATAGTALSTTAIAADRRESTAILDVRYRGPMTGAQSSNAMRRADFTLVAA